MLQSTRSTRRNGKIPARFSGITASAYQATMADEETREIPARGILGKPKQGHTAGSRGSVEPVLCKPNDARAGCRQTSLGAEPQEEQLEVPTDLQFLAVTSNRPWFDERGEPAIHDLSMGPSDQQLEAILTANEAYGPVPQSEI